MCYYSVMEDSQFIHKAIMLFAFFHLLFIPFEDPKNIRWSSKIRFFSLSRRCVLVFMHASHSQSRIHKRPIVSFHSKRKREEKKTIVITYQSFMCVCFLHTVRQIREYYTEHIFTLLPTNKRQNSFFFF